MKPNKARLIRDPVWGDIDVSNPVIKALLDDPLLQRLRRIEMSDFAYLAFPGLSSTRYEHSLGTYHLINMLHYKEKKRNGRAGTEKDYQLERMLAFIGALYHHCTFPPFSYATRPVFEQIFEQEFGDKWIGSLKSLIAEYLYYRYKGKLSKYFSGYNKGQQIKMISYAISRKKQFIMGNPLCLSVFNSLYGVPHGANFLEAVYRPTHMLGHGRGFDYRVVFSSKSSPEGEIPPYVVENIKSAVRSIETLINMVYEDKVNAYASIFVQRLLYGVMKNLPIAHNEKLKPVRDFCANVRKLQDAFGVLKNGNESMDEENRKKLIDALISTLLEIDDFSLYTSLKKTYKDLHDDDADQNLKSLKKVLGVILYGKGVDLFEEKTLDIKKVRGYNEDRHLDNPVALYEFGTNTGRKEILEGVNEELGITPKDKIHPFFSVHLRMPRHRLERYFQNLVEGFDTPSLKNNDEIIRVRREVLGGLERRFYSKALIIRDREYNPS